jgi:DNA-binding MarR family transcriptional regulator
MLDVVSADGRQMWRDLMRATQEVNAGLNRRLQSEAGLSLADFEVLDAIARASQRPVRVYELSEALGWEQSRLSHQLGRMQRRSLVTRAGCAADGRGTFVALTPAGRGAVRRGAAAYERALGAALLDGLTEAQVAALEQTAAAVRGAVG